MDKNSPIPVPFVVGGQLPLLQSKPSEVGVMVFGKNHETTGAVADAITVLLSEQGVRAERHILLSEDGKTQPDHASNREMQNRPETVLDAIFDMNPQLHLASVIVANDTVGLGLVKSKYQNSYDNHSGIDHAPDRGSFTNNGAVLRDTRSNALVYKPEKETWADRRGGYLASGTDSYNRDGGTIAQRGERMKQVIDHAEKRIEDAICGIVKDTIETISTFAGEDQLPIADNVLSVLANSGAMKAGFVRGIEYGQQRGAVSNDVESFIRNARDLKTVSEIGTVFEEEPGTVMVGNRRVRIKPIGDVFDNLIQAKVTAIQANAAVEAAEQGVEKAMEYLAETMEELEGIDKPEEVIDPVLLGPNTQRMMLNDIIHKKAEDLGLDKDVVALQMLKNAEKHGTGGGFSLEILREVQKEHEEEMKNHRAIVEIVAAKYRPPTDAEIAIASQERNKQVTVDHVSSEKELREKHQGISEEIIDTFMGRGNTELPAGLAANLMDSGSDITVTQFDGRTDSDLMATNDPDNDDGDKLTAISPKSKAYVTLQKKLTDGSLELADIDSLLKKGQKAVIGEVTMARF